MNVRHLGMQPYAIIWEKMKIFTDQRTADTPDEIWLLQHPPVYTQGQAGKAEHILNHTEIPVIQTDRGGQITYHGPGQLIAYVLIDLKRKNMGIRTLVCLLESAVINTLKTYQISANRKPGAPGIYIEEKKIASLGLRVRKGCTYHGIALNVNMDLSPFQNINPCGMRQLEMTQVREYNPVDWLELENCLTKHLLQTLTEPAENEPFC